MRNHRDGLRVAAVPTLISASILALAACSGPAAAVVPAGSGIDAGAGGAAETRRSSETPALVSTAWVAERLDAPDVAILYVAMGHDGAPEAWVPGASFLDYMAIQERHGDLPVELPPTEKLVDVFRAAGVDDDEHVVLYGPSPAHLAARAFVTLEVLGHERVSVMDGGLEAWLDEERPTADRPATPERGDFSADPQPGILVSAEQIRDHLDDPGIVLVDARPASQYAGRVGGYRPGHIPGAANIFYADLLVSDDLHRLRPLEEVERIFAEAGATEGSTVISYCQIGMRASYTYLISRHLGFDARFYDPSWAEWGARTDLPAEAGRSRR